MRWTSDIELGGWEYRGGKVSLLLILPCCCAFSPITLVVAKCWDANPRGGFFTIPRQEPVRPIDPRAWILHTNAMTADGATVDGDVVNGNRVANGNGGGGGASGSSTSSGDNSVSTIGNDRRNHPSHHLHPHHHLHRRGVVGGGGGDGGGGGYGVTAAMMGGHQQTHQQMFKSGTQQMNPGVTGYRPPPQASSGMLHGGFPSQVSANTNDRPSASYAEFLARFQVAKLPPYLDN